MTQQTGAERYERTPERQTYRNGYRERDWDTRVGTIRLRIPKLREGSYFPSLLEPRRRAEKALLAVIQQAYVEGVSTRKVDELVKALGMEGISKSQVSRLCQELDEVLNPFRQRELTGEHPYVWLDAKAVKVRYDGRVVSMTAVVAIGVRETGEREVLGFALGLVESYEFWREFLRGLVHRGLKGVQLVILRRPRRAQAGHCGDSERRQLAALPRAFYAQPPDARPQADTGDGGGPGAHHLRPARCGPGAGAAEEDPPTACGPAFPGWPSSCWRRPTRCSHT